MKKIIGITLALLLVTMASFAQQTALQTAATESVKKCIPTKACAEKAGVTLAECKKVCEGKSAGVSATTVATQVASVAIEADTEVEAKESGASLKVCAAKAGMTVKECKKKCNKTVDAMDDKETKVAAATLVNEIEEIQPSKTDVKKCCKSAAACKKKQD